MKEQKTIGQLIEHDFTKGDLELYDVNGKMVYREVEAGYWWRYEYNANGKNDFEKNSTGECLRREFDEHGNTIYSETLEEDGYKYWRRMEYNQRNQLIKREESNGCVSMFGYNPDGSKSWTSFDGEVTYHDIDPIDPIDY